MTDLWLFLLAVLTVLATPGPTNTLLATAGATAGFRASAALPQNSAAISSRSG
jgi:threonine/homoserine/homoserine lactone efflux protein